MDVLAAIKTLRQELEAGTEASKAVQFAAEEWEVKENVLIARFEKAYGVAPKDFVAPNVPTVAELVERTLADRKKNMRFSGDLAERAYGHRFFYDGEWYRFAGFDGTKLFGVRELSGRIWWMKGRKAQTAMTRILNEVQAAA